MRNSLVGQGLRLCASSAGGTSLIPHTLWQASPCTSPKEKKTKMLYQYPVKQISEQRKLSETQRDTSQWPRDYYSLSLHSNLTWVPDNTTAKYMKRKQVELGKRKRQIHN